MFLFCFVFVLFLCFVLFFVKSSEKLYVIHVEIVTLKKKPIWKNLFELIKDKHATNFTISLFHKIVDIQDDKFLSFLFICVKY